MALDDTFSGNDAQLVLCIEALIDLNDKGALRPHGVGGHARKLLSAAAVRLLASLQNEAVTIDTLIAQRRVQGEPHDH